ncbi:magnesium transporter [Xanthobacter autotrophicus]|uniref:magnesium transporter n=1 Tax=Xanthobacter autotrophicus TaxID=280 RepID=UPI0024A747CC|nr:magnesium transporter [Xanthobacter autotrophicus]MDI4656181.1 magnesium transporter [Xanthobacter autotrophicus]
MNIVTTQDMDKASIAARLGHEHVADIVEFLNGKTAEDATELVAHMPLQWAVEVLDQPQFQDACEVIEALPQDKAVALLEGMSADRASDVLRWIEEPARGRLREALTPETRSGIDHLLTYPDGSAGALMTTEFVSVPSNWTVGQTLAHIREVEHSRETVYAIYVLTPDTKRLVNTVSLRRLIFGEPDAPISSVANPYAPITVPPTMPQEEVARTISKYDFLAVPVVDSTGHVLGIVTVDDVIDAMIEEQTEDVQRMGGMEAIDKPYLDISFFEMIKKRGGWLCVLFLSEMLTTSAMQVYADELEKAIVLALFIPLVMSSGGNSGSQATSLIIRALALHEVRLRDWWRVALREFPTGITLGAILGIIGIVRIVVWQEAGIFDYGEHWKLLAMTIGAALIGIVTFGSMAGSLLPFALKRLGFDPASASAPFIATLVDVTGIVIYFSVAWLFLHGTIL